MRLRSKCHFVRISDVACIGPLAVDLAHDHSIVTMPSISSLNGLTERAPHLALVAFHTTFNVLGVVIVLPFTRPFARLMTRLVPERGPDLTARLDTNLLGDPAAATLALAGTLRA